MNEHILGDMFAQIENYSHIGLAVSGGVDSFALMALFAQWQKTHPHVRATVYTVNHGLRAEAAQETAFVAKIANEFGFETRELLWENPQLGSRFQANARHMRYRLIGQAMAVDGAEILLTGHNADDQAETILMRLAHGSGMRGLAGMRAFSGVENVRIFRPMLSLERIAVEKIWAVYGVEPIRDPSNASEKYERVRWRKANSFLAGLGLTSQRLGLAGGRIARADDFIASVVVQEWKKKARVDAFGIVHLSLESFVNLHAEIRIRLLAHMRDEVRNERSFDLARMEALDAQIQRGYALGADNNAAAHGICKHSIDGVIYEIQRGTLLCYREVGRIVPETVLLPVGVDTLWDGRFVFHAKVIGMQVVSGVSLTREIAENLIGAPYKFSMQSLAGAPVVLNTKGEFIAIGGFSVSLDLVVQRITA